MNIWISAKNPRENIMNIIAGPRMHQSRPSVVLRLWGPWGNILVLGSLPDHCSQLPLFRPVPKASQLWKTNGRYRETAMRGSRSRNTECIKDQDS